jgi:hypothetical protein
MSAGVSWRVPDTPAGGWDELTFPVEILAAPQEKQWFMAYQWAYTGGGNVAYTGVQPAPGDTQDLRFSVFGQADAVDHDLCSGGADGGSGVTCDGTTIPLVKSRVYRLRVARDRPGSRIWTGTVTDAETGQSWPTGAWRIPVDGGLPGQGVAWLEHYRACDCDKMPLLSVRFGAPIHEPSGTVGYCYDAHDGGGCSGRSGWAAEELGDGRVWMRRGWPGRSCHDLDRVRTQPDPQVTVNVNVNVNTGRNPL